jgi:hypothetical protein
MVPAVESERLVPCVSRKDDFPACTSTAEKNPPSQAVAKRWGASHLPPATLRGQPRLCFRHRLPV